MELRIWKGSAQVAEVSVEGDEALTVEVVGAGPDGTGQDLVDEETRQPEATVGEVPPGDYSIVLPGVGALDRRSRYFSIMAKMALVARLPKPSEDSSGAGRR